MIRVRPTKPTTEFVTAGVNELKKYRQHMRTQKAAVKAGKKKQAFKFKIYGQAREALTELFHGKCSYCEAELASVMPGDVEHFRPKGGVLVGKKLMSGYYWLAATWDNLLISCRDCNSHRNQRIKGVPGRVLVGKLNQFPLHNESHRARRPRDVANEVPLLLNPYIDDPERFLTYELDADRDIIVKPLKKGGLALRKAEKSIEVYALPRSGLVHSRTLLAKRIMMDVDRIRWFQTQLVRDRNNSELERRLLEELELLKDYTEPDKRYAGMARCLINPVIAEMIGRIPKKLSSRKTRTSPVRKRAGSSRRHGVRRAKR